MPVLKYCPDNKDMLLCAVRSERRAVNMRYVPFEKKPVIKQNNPAPSFQSARRLY